MSECHVNLWLYFGAMLADPGGLLGGAGRKLRHVKVCSLDMARCPAAAALISEGLVERRHALGLS